jgi:hypothetical protein
MKKPKELNIMIRLFKNICSFLPHLHFYFRRENIRKCVICGNEQMRDIIIMNDRYKGITLVKHWKNCPNGMFNL